MLNKKDIQHHFGTTCHDIVSLFDNTNKLSTFMTKLESQAILHEDNYPRNDYVGDGFEFLMEIFIKISKFDKRIGISDYHIVKNNEDIGIDGLGINLTGDKCVIQHKYRSNSKYLLTANKDHLSNMFSAAQTRYSVSTKKSEIEYLNNLFEKNTISKSNYNNLIKKLNKSTYRHYVFTTGEGLNFFTDSEMYSNEVKCFGYKDLRYMLDENIYFWELCRTLAKEFKNG